MSDTIKVTKVSLAAQLGCTVDEAYLLLRFAEMKGWSTNEGNEIRARKPMGMKLYGLPANIGDQFKLLFDRLVVGG